MAAWIAGGLIALIGGFIYAELAARLPVVGGQYAYLREALHPALAFIYGWVLLLVIQTGGMAAVAVMFARYFLELTHWPINDSLVAAAVLAVLTIINCLGVRAGSRVQSTMTLTAIGAIALLDRLQPLVRRNRAHFVATCFRSTEVVRLHPYLRNSFDAGGLRLWWRAYHYVFSAAKFATRTRLCRARSCSACWRSSPSIR